MKHNKLQLLRGVALAAALSITSAGITIAADTSPATPTPPPQPPARDQGAAAGRANAEMRVMRGGQAMGLDESQMQLFREAMQKNNDELRKLDEQLRNAQRELMKAILAEKYDEKTVREKAEVVAKLQTDMLMLRAKALSTVAPTLKPDQREQLENNRFSSQFLLGGQQGQMMIQTDRQDRRMMDMQGGGRDQNRGQRDGTQRQQDRPVR